MIASAAVAKFAHAPASGLNRFALVCLVVFLSIVLMSFNKAFVCGFLADDYVALKEVATTDWISTLLSPWQSTNFQELYRPFSQLSFILDHWLYGRNAMGFHLTNLVVHSLAAVFLALSVREIGRAQELPRAEFLGFAAGAIMAVAPLHCETVIWITGRVDALATMFLLAAFWCFLRTYHENGSSAKLSRSLLPVLFGCGVLCKESAVVLPLVATLYAAVLPRSGESPWRRIKLAVKILVPLFFALFFIVGCRYIVLGTASGGYLGSMPNFDLSEFVNRFGPQPLWRLFFPFNVFAIREEGPIYLLMRWFYVLLSIRIVLNVEAYAGKSVYLRLWLFACGAFWISFLPVLSIAFMGSDALGSRFFYMSGAWLALGFALLIVPSDVTRSGRYLALSASALLLLAFLMVRGVVTQANSVAWVGGADLTAHIRGLVAQVVRQIPPGSKILYVNPPRQYQGVHICYNSTMLSALLEENGDRVLSVQPRYFWNRDPVSLAQLEQFAERRDIAVSLIDNAGAADRSVCRNQSLTAVQCDATISDQGAIVLLPTPAVFHFDARQVAGCKQMLVQISRPNQSFSLFGWQAFYGQLRLRGDHGKFWLTKWDLWSPGVYEMRFAAGDGDGKPLEPWSNLLVLRR